MSNGLVQEYAREPDEDDDKSRTRFGASPRPGSTGTRRKIVFYLGADSNRVPKPYPSRAVLHPHNRRAPGDGTLLVPAVARAAREHYPPLVRAGRTKREVLPPSPYLEEAAGALGRPIDLIDCPAPPR